MKLFKKLMSYFIALTMVLSLATLLGGNVHAEGTTTYTLTLTGTATGHTYEAYQVFTGDLSGDTLSNVQWGSGVKWTGTETAAQIAEKLSNKTMSLEDLTNQLSGENHKLSLTSPAKTVESSKGSTVINDLTAGYYLVKDKDGTQKDTSDAYTKFIVQVVGNASVNVKSSVPTVTKKVDDKNDSTGAEETLKDSADYDIGDKVPYTITGTLPSTYADYNSYVYTFTDTMCKGLTYTASTDTQKNYKVMLYTSASDTTGTDVTRAFSEDVKDVSSKDEYNEGHKITWSCSDLKSNNLTKNATKDSKFVLTYNATLNTYAKIGAAGNPNKVDLTYSNNPNNGGSGETGKTPEDKNIVFTYKTVFNKVNEKNEALSGAGFTLNKWNGSKFVATDKTATVKDGTTFTFSGLDDGIYQLEESTTPAGYNTMKPLEFEIYATHTNDPETLELTSLTMKKMDPLEHADQTLGDDVTGSVSEGSMTTNVVNKKGSTLPSTGGMGTTLLYVAGGILVACAAAYVVLNKKRA